MRAVLGWVPQVEKDIVRWVTCDLHEPWLGDLLLASQSKEVAVPVLLAAFALLGLRRPRVALRSLVTCAAAWGLAMGLATILWATIDRPRPQKVFSTVLRTPEELATCEARPDALALRTGGSSRPSFPSRHGLTIGVFVTALWLASRPLGWIAAVWGLVAAVGRVYAGKHWPSDVLAGIVLGVAITWAVSRLLRRLVPPPPALATAPAGPAGAPRERG
jgi:membrane-associated phospholipid phosphatase